MDGRKYYILLSMMEIESLLACIRAVEPVVAESTKIRIGNMYYQRKPFLYHIDLSFPLASWKAHM
jgi:hypothetical protein